MTKEDYYEVVDSLAVLNWITQQPDLHDFYADKIKESIGRLQDALPPAEMAKAQKRWDQIGKQKTR